MTSIVVAGILGVVGTGSYLTVSATADERPARMDAKASGTTINVDSLYAAKADESTGSDTAFLAPVAPENTLSGRISWYGPGFHGRRTANGERFDRNEMTAAHKTLPFGTLLRVEDQATGRSILVRVNDRGPYSGGRILDLSEAAARRLGITGRGTASARLSVYSLPKSKNGNAAVTFDTQGNAVTPHGFTVKVAAPATFDEAIALQQKLEQNGYDKVFLTQFRNGTHTSFAVSVGLFSSERLCSTLLADVSDTFSAAVIRSFERIDDANDGRQLADTATSGEERL